MITDEGLAQLGHIDRLNELKFPLFTSDLLAEFRESMNQKLDWSDSPTNLQVEDMLSFYLDGNAI